MRRRRESDHEAELPIFEEIVPRAEGEPTGGNSPDRRHSAPKLQDLAASLEAIPVDWDDWELDEDLQRAEQLTGEVSRRPMTENAASPVRSPRPAFADLPGRRTNRESRSTRPSIGQALSWLVLCLGLMPFVCGVVLVGWSFFSGRDDLWRIGVPLTLAGQTGWLVGVLLQLDAAWRSHVRNAQKLEQLEARVDELQESTALLSVTHSGDSRSFYAHFADGAGPNLLLADLKGQLDLLAMQLARQRAA